MSFDSFEEILYALQSARKENDQLTYIADIVNMLKSRGFGPMLMAPALIAVLPTGVIPGVPTLCGFIIILISGQMLLGKEVPWIPKKIQNISFEDNKFKKAMDKIEPYAKRIDAYTSSRLLFLTNSISKRFIALLCILLGVALIPLEAIPFGVMIPSLGLILISLGLTIKDGLLLAIGLFTSLGALLSAYIWLF